jgi:phospholipase C
VIIEPVNTRREFFRRAAALTGGAQISGALLGTVARALAIDPPNNSSFLDAEHVVILMQENRSFDHMFGALRGVRGFGDPRAVTLPDGKPVWMQTNAAGETYAPFRLDLTGTKATWLGSLPHSWRDQTDARNHGNHDGWLEAKRSSHADCAHMPLTMGYYDREDLPFYYALADAFTVCDQHFCSSLTGTTPNRLHLWTGTIREKPDAALAPNVRNSDVDYGSTVHWKTFPERLDAAGVSWRVYQNELSVPTGLEGEQDAWLANFTDNPLEWFDQYHVEFRKTHQEYCSRLAARLPAEIAQLRAQGRSERELAAKEKLLKYVEYSQSRSAAGTLAGLSPLERGLHERAFTTNEDDPAYRQLSRLRYRDGASTREMDVPKGDPLYRFRKDVENGTLPAVSWLVPSERLSDHPGSPWYGAWFTAETMNVLTRNPQVWSKTIFILTYDENDGYFDHVPPFVAPQPGNPASGKTSPAIGASLEYFPLEQDLKRNPAKEARGGPVGLGYRVPLIVMSPWSRGGYVCSQVFDHTSVLQLLERVTSRRAGKEIRETNINAWRRAVCGDLSSAFRPFEDGRNALPFPSRDLFFEQIHRAQFARMPSGYRRLTAKDAAEFGQDRRKVDWMPRQEAGIRPSAALPYELAASGALSSDTKRLEITLEARTGMFGKSAAGAPFHVYTPGKFQSRADLRTRAYAVTAGEHLSDAWELDGFENGAYHVRVCGPNGFFREFVGGANDPEIAIKCEYTGSGDIRVWAKNRSSGAVTLLVRDEAYGAGTNSMQLPSGEEHFLEIGLTRSHNWYDLSVSLTHDTTFLRRFAGRVENGKDGYSDPALG